MDEKNKEKIRASITDLELNVEHARNAPLVMKAKHAEVAVDSCVKCIKLMARNMGVFNDGD